MCTLPSVSPQARRLPVEHQRSLDKATSSCSVSRGTWEGGKERGGVEGWKRKRRRKKSESEAEGGIHKKGKKGGRKETEEEGGEEQNKDNQLVQTKDSYNRLFPIP